MSWDWSPELITAIVAVFIAAIALFVAIYEARATRKHNRLSVQPILIIDITSKFTEDGGFSIVYDLRNAGFGPAIIRDSILSFGELKISMKDKDAAERLKKQAPASFNYYGAFDLASNMNVIGPDKNSEFFSIKVTPAADKDVETTRDIARRLHIKIEYQSVYQNETFVCIINSSKLKDALHKSQKESKT